MAHTGYMTHNERDMIHNSQRKLDSGSITDPIEALRLLCLVRGYSGILGFGRVFREMDHNGKKNLNRHEFVKALENCGLELPNGEAEKIFRHFDNHGNGKISVRSLLDGVRPVMSQLRKSIVHAAFTKMDTNETGVITMDQLKHCYNVGSNQKFVAGVETKEEILKTFLDHFEEHHRHNGCITNEDFENYYAAMSASIDDDTFFDLVIRQVYKL